MRSLLHLFLDSLQIEACPLLHGRKLDRALGELSHLLLNGDKTPKLVSPPIRRKQRLIEPGAFKWVQAEVDEDRPIDFDRPAEPTVWLIGEAVFEVIDAYRTQRAFG